MIEYIEVLIRLAFAFLAGGLIGLDREVLHKPAGIRTHMLVCLGSALFVMITPEMMPNEVARVIAGVATGIGFLGAGTIFKSKSDVQGLTTAASIWSVAGIGLAIGIGEYFIALVGTVLVLVVLQLNKLEFIKRLEK